jgi:hypothetical protein
MALEHAYITSTSAKFSGNMTGALVAQFTLERGEASLSRGRAPCLTHLTGNLLNGRGITPYTKLRASL